MYDAFTRCLYGAPTAKNGLAEAFSSLPVPVLQKLAAGKLAYCDTESEWLDKFKGTPLFDQALALLQEEVHSEAESLQRRAESNRLGSADDQIRLKKKLLDLELARLSVTQPTLSPEEQAQQQVPTAEPMAPGAGTLPNVQASDMWPAKKASVAPVALIRYMLEKQAGAGSVAARLGKSPTILDFIKKNPGLVTGAGLGTLGGAATGYHEGGVTGALAGGVGGGALGGALGLGTQGLVRAGLGARELSRQGVPGTAAQHFGQQSAIRASEFAKNIGLPSVAKKISDLASNDTIPGPTKAGVRL